MKKLKIPGMLYILISFIPWVVYWSFSNTKNIFSIFIPFIISIFLLYPQIKKRDFNLMDIFTFFYFLTALFASLFTKKEIFYENSGLFGYFTLFMMALFSIIIKNPYTFQVSKKIIQKFIGKM